MTGSEPRRAGCPAAGVPRVETTVDCGVPPPPTPPGFAPLPISPNFIADSTTCPLTRSPGFPGRLAILHPTDHIHVAHTRRIQSLEASHAQLSSHRNRSPHPSNQSQKEQNRRTQRNDPTCQDSESERSREIGDSRAERRNVTLHRRRTVREPAARQVRKQLTCSGFAVRWKRLFDALNSHSNCNTVIRE
jgi:hypothetical protein